MSTKNSRAEWLNLVASTLMVTICIEKVNQTVIDAVDKTLDRAGLPASLAGESILLKPNLFEPVSCATGQTTSPRVVEAVIRCCYHRGARAVTVGEGPSYFLAEHALKECFTKTGMAEVCARCEIPWVLFDEHPYRIYKNASPSLPPEFSISEHAFMYDKIINLPVPKTHYLTTVSIAMKNLKGFVRREDKPLFHRVGVEGAVAALNTLIKPFMNLVDFTAPAHQQTGFILAGRDIVAVDSVSSALMGFTPDAIATVRLGHQAGLGQMDLTRIDVRGEALKGLKMNYELPSRWLEKTFPDLTIRGDDRACSGCIIPLFSCLQQLAAENRVFRDPLAIVLGSVQTGEDSADILTIGNCSAYNRGKRGGVSGCPPDRAGILKALAEHTIPRS